MFFFSLLVRRCRQEEHVSCQRRVEKSRFELKQLNKRAEEDVHESCFWCSSRIFKDSLKSSFSSRMLHPSVCVYLPSNACDVHKERHSFRRVVHSLQQEGEVACDFLPLPLPSLSFMSLEFTSTSLFLDSINFSSSLCR